MFFAFSLLIALVYLFGAFLVGAYMKSLEPKNLRWALVCIFTAVVFHFALIIHLVSSSSNSNIVESTTSNLLLTAFVALAAGVLVLRKWLLGVVLFALVFNSSFLVVSPFFENPNVGFSIPSLWVWTHVGLMILGELMFFFAAATGAAYLLASRQLHQKKNISFVLGTASLPSLDRLIGRAIILGWVLLTLGVVLGTLFAKQFWTGAWWFDEKILFAGFTWLVYGTLILLRSLKPAFRGHKSAWIALLSFIVVLALSTGVDYFFQTKHSQMQIESGQE